MIIKLDDIYSANENTIIVDYEKENKEFDTKNLINTKLKIKKIANSLHITGKISGWIELTCDRCLNIFNYKLDINVDEKISLIPLFDYSNKEIKLKDTELEDELLDTDKIDIDNFVYQTVTLSLPNKIVCGINCNIESDDETNGFIQDSRLEIFNKIKKEK